MKKNNFLKAKQIQIDLKVSPVCKDSFENKTDCEDCIEKAKQETRKIMDDIWSRYPNAEISRANLETNNVVFEL